MNREKQMVKGAYDVLNVSRIFFLGDYNLHRWEHSIVQCLDRLGRRWKEWGDMRDDSSEILFKSFFFFFFSAGRHC